MWRCFDARNKRHAKSGTTCKKPGEQLYLATIIHVEGSSYPKPGARMLVTSGGERAGTISGGCLDAEVSQKIAWLSAEGGKVETIQFLPRR
ncbi:XdhC family protein [Acidisarcina polymorpha]